MIRVPAAALLGTDLIVVDLILPITRHQRLESIDLKLRVPHKVFLNSLDRILNLLFFPHDLLKLLLESLLIELLTILSAPEILDFQLFSLLFHDLELAFDVLVALFHFRQRLPVLLVEADLYVHVLWLLEVLQTLVICLGSWRCFTRYAMGVALSSLLFAS